MELAVIGLGKMGSAIAVRLARGGHQVIVYNRTVQRTFDLAKEEPRLIPLETLQEIRTKLRPPRIAWTMLPAGGATEDMIVPLSDILSAGDTIIDGGNAHFRDSMRRARTVEEKGMHFLDVGVSGGVWGLTGGYCMMIGGREETVRRLRGIFETLAPEPDQGWCHVGPAGAGHFVKMIHNGIEYGLMQAYAEGFEILKASKDFQLDLGAVAGLWRHGSVIRSWLLDLISLTLSENPELVGIKGWVADSGEGRWTVLEAINEEVPAPAITLSLPTRLASRQEDSYSAKLLAAMRSRFGGHDVMKE